MVVTGFRESSVDHISDLEGVVGTGVTGGVKVLTFGGLKVPTC